MLVNAGLLRWTFYCDAHSDLWRWFEEVGGMMGFWTYTGRAAFSQGGKRSKFGFHNNLSRNHVSKEDPAELFTCLQLQQNSTIQPTRSLFSPG